MTDPDTPATPSLHQQHPDLLDWQERLTDAVHGCLRRGMTPGDVADWVSETLTETD